ncbi:MAG: PHP domain-containing protein [Ruminococcaceae bacterium]|nr:PHP domain-containing protein [Oscillospiraceae bacterium]
MTRYYYDLHLHSCLSPCGDADMTPNNIAGMATLCGLNIVALTDHNTCRNCPAFYRAAKKNGIIPVAGMELTTAEEVHVVCLFERLEDAMAFDELVAARLMPIMNEPEIFGEQLILDENDEPIGTVDTLLISATDIGIDEVPELVEGLGGICYPAHIDRKSNSIINQLGFFPEFPVFGCVELREAEKLAELTQQFPLLAGKKVVCSSDAHYLTQMRDKQAYFELEDQPYSGDLVRHNMFMLLREAE